MKSQSKPILLIITLSLALNLHGLASDSFWGDEILTATFASFSPLEIIRWTATDIHPPLYYLLASGFNAVSTSLSLSPEPSPASDWLWRFPSVIAGVLAVAITYNLAYRLSTFVYQTNPQSGAIKRLMAYAAALLLTVAPMAIKYGQETRMHALFMMLAALSSWLFFRAMSRPEQWGRWLLYGLSIAASIYTMYFGFLILSSHAGYVLLAAINQKRTRHHIPRPTLTGFAGAIIIAFLIYLPWWPILFNILRKRAAVGAIEGGVGLPTQFVSGVIEALGPAPTLAAWGFLLLFGIGITLLAGQQWPLAAFGLLWLALPTLLPIILGDPRALQFRYAFVLPIYLTFIAYTLVYSGLYIDAKLTTNVQQKNAQQNSTPTFQSYPVSLYLIWVTATIAFVATWGIYNQSKPNWRQAGAYLNAHTAPADIILIGPLWDEGRFIAYYYRGPAQLLTPAAMVANIEGRIEGLRAGGGRIWAVNRFAPAETGNLKNNSFSGVVVSEPQVTVYEAQLLREVAIDLAAQAVDAAYPWAAEAEAQGVLNPDPRTAQAAALRAWGDTLLTAGQPEAALVPYQTAVDIFPGWVSGFIALAEAQEAVGNIPAAVKAYQQAVAFNQHWQGTPADEAAALAQANQWATALDKYHQIIGE